VDAEHHVWARGVKRERIFLDDEDYRRYTRMLRAVVEKYGWELLAFCLLPNHVHFIVGTPNANLAAGMQWLHSRYALSFNERYGPPGNGHVFQGPYGSRRINDDVGFMRAAAYVTMNAVVAGLCTHPAGWRWSSQGFAARRLGGEWMAHESFSQRLQRLTDSEDWLRTIVL
jgi:REP element-mobilizing transposase RayT